MQQPFEVGRVEARDEGVALLVVPCLQLERERKLFNVVGTT